MAAALADLFCRESRRRVRDLFRGLWSNDDYRKYQVGQQVLRGEQSWIEEGRVGSSASATAASAAREVEAESVRSQPGA